MKKGICILLVLICCMQLIGCGPETAPEDTQTTGTQATTLPEETTTVPEETTLPEETTTVPEETIEATEHTHAYEKVITVQASCTKEGTATFTCACGDSFTEKVAALGHSYSAVNHSKEGYTEYTCKRCDLSYKEYHNESSGQTSFFDDAAFIGDSVTLKLRNYHQKTKALGNTTFLCVGSYSVNNALTGQLMLTYKGKEMGPADALAACGAKKVFILLGMNDIALTGIDKAIDNWATLIKRIRAKNPDIQIYIQSGTPIYKSGEIGDLNNANMDKYNVRLQAFAQENGCQYIDIASPMKDSSNGLAEKYCSDAYVHFTDAACKLWVDILKKAVGA